MGLVPWSDFPSVQPGAVSCPQPSSLHYNDPTGRPNQYLAAIQAVGDIIQVSPHLAVTQDRAPQNIFCPQAATFLTEIVHESA